MKGLTNKAIRLGERMIQLVLLSITTLGFMPVFSNQGLSLSYFSPNGDRAQNHESSRLVISRDSFPENRKPITVVDVAVQSCPEADQLRKNVQQLTGEVQRLLALGATEVHWEAQPPDADYVILADPEGNRFCVVDTRPRSHVP